MLKKDIQKILDDWKGSENMAGILYANIEIAIMKREIEVRNEVLKGFKGLYDDKKED